MARPAELYKLRAVRQVFNDCQSIASFGPTFSLDEQKTCLSIKYGYKMIADLIDILVEVGQKLPMTN